ncbi:MAG: nitroreductase family deazaflavin-dependent oxidoreductase [bacterium]
MGTPRPFTKTEVAISNPLIKAMSRLNTWAYRATGGRLGGKFVGGAPVLLLTTVGRKSGEPRVAPLIYLQDNDRYVVVASKGGMDHHPLWYTNLVANPDVEVQVGRRVQRMRARTAGDAERTALWPRLVAIYRPYTDYQARTQRRIPLVVLEPVA